MNNIFPFEPSERDKEMQKALRSMYEWIEQTQYTIILTLGADLKLKKTGEFYGSEGYGPNKLDKTGI